MLDQSNYFRSWPHRCKTLTFGPCSNSALTETEMRRIAPSIFAVTAHESRSERFQPIPTIDVLRGLIWEGFMPVGAKQSCSRSEGKADFTKHLIRLRSHG
jgi:hypothetical protein